MKKLIALLFGSKQTTPVVQEEKQIEPIVEVKEIVVEPIQEPVVEPVKEEVVETVEAPKVEEETYYISLYTSNGKDKIKGNWKLSQQEADDEANSYLYKHKLGYTRTDTASITKSKVQAIADQHKMSIGDVLSCI